MWDQWDITETQLEQLLTTIRHSVKLLVYM